MMEKSILHKANVHCELMIKDKMMMILTPYRDCVVKISNTHLSIKADVKLLRKKEKEMNR